MGLHMDDLHTPTVASGPNSSFQASKNGDEDKKSLLDLMADKDRLEEELNALMSVLESHNVNMSTSLTTFDGFPRPDIDVAQIRTTRARIIHLRNDYKALMSKIEVGLHAHHASIQQAAAASRDAKTTSSASMQRDKGGVGEQSGNGSGAGLIETPFAKVNSVVEGGPADAAGLKAGDTIRTFGTANWMNQEKLSKVAEVVQRSEGRSVLVKVVRDDPANAEKKELQLQLTPRRNWGGRGLLGCHLLPL